MPEVIDVPEAAVAGLNMPVFGLAGAEDPERTTIERLDGLVRISPQRSCRKQTTPVAQSTQTCLD
jgi:hypothetical protein